MRVAVCYQDVDPSRGGAETFVVDLCRGLVRAGHQVILLAERWAAGCLPEQVEARAVETRGRTRLGRIWNFACSVERTLADPRLRYDCSLGFINTWGQDVLIPQGGVRAASLDANARRFPVTISLAYRTAKRIHPRWWVYRAIERRQYDPARNTRFVAVSHMVMGHLQRYHGVDPARIDVVPNAIDEERLRCANPPLQRAALRALLNLEPTALVGLFVGHNYHLKGLGPLIRGLARQSAGRNQTPIHLAVCGGGRPRPFQKLAARLGVADRIHFVGYLPDMRAGYHGADFCVLPSYYDPCSLVVFEALACGLPVITTRQNGAGELIEPGVHGYVVDRPDDLDALAGALNRMTDEPHRLQLGTAARRLGREQTFERYLERLIAVLARAAEQRRLSHGPQTHAPGRFHAQGGGVGARASAREV